MAEQPFDGLPSDDEPADETAPEPDDAIEGTVVPFPGAAQPPAPRKARFGEAAELRPILPAHLQSWAAARKHYGWHLKRGRHHFLYHLVRVPPARWHTLRYAVLGVLKLGWLQVNWWWCTEQTYLRMQAVANNDPRTWESLHKHAVKRRAFRGACSLPTATSCSRCSPGRVTRVHARWGWIPIAALVVMPLLAWFGHPDDKPILTSATVPVAYRGAVVRGHHPRPGGAALAGINQALPRTGRTPSCSSTRSSGTGRGGWPGSTCRTA